MTRTRSTLAAIALAAGTLSGAHAQTIADITPADAIFVASADSWTDIQAKADRIGLMDLWGHPQIQRFVGAITDEISEDMAEMSEMMEDLDMDPAEFPRPTGTMGVAIFAQDETLHLLSIADFGDNAEEAEEQLETMLDGLQDEEIVELDIDKVGDIRIHVITMLEPEEDADDDMEDDWDDEWGWEEPEPMFPSIETMHVARVGNHLVASSDLVAIEDAIAAVDNGRDLDALADTPAYADSMAQHPDEADMFAAYFIGDDMRNGFGEGLGMAFPMGLPMDPAGISKALGIDDLQAVSIAVTLDTDDAMAEQSIGILVPNRAGLFGLITPSTEPFIPPAFVGADAASVARVNVAFDRIFPLLKDILGTMPDQMQAQLGGMLDGIEGLYAPILKTLGPDVYIAQTIERPLSVTSATTVVAVRARDQLSIANAIGGMAGQFGMEARDFQGHQLYEDPMSGQGLGIGFGYLFVGDTTDIENAMRQADNPGDNVIANEDRFIDGTEAINDDAVFATFTDLRQTIELTVWQMKNAEKMFEAQMQELGIDPELMQEDMGPMTNEWADKIPDVEVFLEYIGDTVGDIRATDDGFRGRFLMLRPRNRG